MSVLDKLGSKHGMPDTEGLKAAVLRCLEDNHVRAARACFRRPDAYQRKIAAILCVRELTSASLVEAKKWVEANINIEKVPG